MTTPAQTQPASPLEQWFDAKLRPVLLEHLANADGGAAQLADTRHKTTIAALEHWLTTLPQKSASWSPETREVVTALASEIRGVLDSVGAF
jgi:hypothetical protein